MYFRRRMEIKIYTDGAAKGNPGPGGYGTVLLFKNQRKELSGGFRLTTNNRMELLAVIEGLRALKSADFPVKIYSDSKYVVDSIEKKWVFGWVQKSFKGKANADLWKIYLPLHQIYKPSFIWVKGHAGNIENERCDQLAVAASECNDLAIDQAYETLKDSI